MPTLAGEQKRLVDETIQAILNRKLSDQPKFHVTNTAPGAGKTTTIMQLIKQLMDEHPQFINDMIENNEKILIAVLNKKNKIEIEKKAKELGLYQDILEITTIHSLFNRYIKEISSSDQKNLGGFELDYTKSTFTKNMISYVFQSICKRDDSPTDEVEQKLRNKRLFDPSLMTSGNIDIAWSLVNSYFSSTVGLTEIDEIERVATFFGKKAVSIDDFDLNEDALAILDKIWKKLPGCTSPQDALFRILVLRTVELATTKIRNIETTVSDITTSFPIVIEEGRGGRLTAVDTFVENVQRKKLNVTEQNIFKVPHNYYYRMFYNVVSTDSQMLEKVFKKFVAAFMDEYQDHDKLVYKILHALLKQQIVKTVVTIGDSLQGIYAFKSPDHFDALAHILKNVNSLEADGIGVEHYDFKQTYRFGNELATFVNHYFGSNIIGKQTPEDFVHPEELKHDNLADVLSQLSSKGSTAIICRSNQEAARLYMMLQTQGYQNTRLESSIKEEITTFAKKGLLAIEEDKVRFTLYKELCSVYGRKNMSDFTYEDILNNNRTKKILHDEGYPQLTRFEAKDIEKYIISSNRKTKDITWIGTSHLFKGSEFDHVLIGTDFFARNLGGGQGNEQTFEEQPKQETKSIFAKEIEKMFGSIPVPESETTESIIDDEVIAVSQNHSLLNDVLNAPGSEEEKNILYVALTRAKKGTYFIESPLAKAMLTDFPLNRKMHLERGGEAITATQEEDIKIQSEANLFGENLNKNKMASPHKKKFGQFKSS